MVRILKSKLRVILVTLQIIYGYDGNTINMSRIKLAISMNFSKNNNVLKNVSIKYRVTNYELQKVAGDFNISENAVASILKSFGYRVVGIVEDVCNMEVDNDNDDIEVGDIEGEEIKVDKRVSRNCSEQQFTSGSLLHSAKEAGLLKRLIKDNDATIMKITNTHLSLTRNTSIDVKRLMLGKLRTILGYFIILLLIMNNIY